MKLTFTLTLWFDLDELEYCVNINEGPVPDETFGNYDAAKTWCDGFIAAMTAAGRKVDFTDAE